MLILTILLCSLLNTVNSSQMKIVYTNDIEGTVTTCGCAKDPGGGVTRRLSWLNGSKLDPFSTVYINAGNTLFSDLPSLEHEDKTEKFGAEIISDTMITMGIDAFTPGRSDFKKGVAFFNTAAKKLPVVISNSEDPNYKKSLVLDKAGKKVIILGAIQPNSIDQTASLQLKLYDTVKALKKELKALNKAQKQKPYTIVLLFSNEDELNKITKQVKGIDLILSANMQEELPQALKVNGVNVLRLLNGGDSIGLFNAETDQNEITFLGPKFETKNKLSEKVKKYLKTKN